MKNIFVPLVIIVIGIAGYFLYNNTKTPETESVINEVISGTATSELQAGSDSGKNNINAALKQEAQSYIREISKPDPEPVDATGADNFVTRDQVISLAGKQNVEQVKPSELLGLAGLTENSPITIITEQQQIENINVARILEESGGQLDTRITILDGDEIRETTVEKIIAEHEKDELIPVIRKVEQFEIKTPAEILADTSIDKDKPMKIIKEPYRLETTTVGELLMGEDDVTGENVYYVRNVSENDDQGIWGIVHNGLIENFATGIALRRGETIRKYRIKIPRDADEVQGDLSSSYLGRLIQEKTSESFVYNFKQGKMGRNPDLIYPGQEIIIIKFSTDELIDIYQHFVENINS